MDGSSRQSPHAPTGLDTHVRSDGKNNGTHDQRAHRVSGTGIEPSEPNEDRTAHDSEGAHRVGGDVRNRRDQIEIDT